MFIAASAPGLVLLVLFGLMLLLGPPLRGPALLGLAAQAAGTVVGLGLGWLKRRVLPPWAPGIVFVALVLISVVVLPHGTRPVPDLTLVAGSAGGMAGLAAGGAWFLRGVPWRRQARRAAVMVAIAFPVAVLAINVGEPGRVRDALFAVGIFAACGCVVRWLCRRARGTRPGAGDIGSNRSRIPTPGSSGGRERERARRPGPQRTPGREDPGRGRNSRT
ncbi:MAG: hypothetical protein HY744_05880 [Deltaproteobacteria bacterium]|nr:hypothetical protein [Deltaproteobacteria bacterium]